MPALAGGYISPDCFEWYETNNYNKEGLCVCGRNSTVVRILPRHLRELTQPADIRAAHETLVGTAALHANVAFLEILKQWPLFGAIQFEVSVSCAFSFSNIIVNSTLLIIYIFTQCDYFNVYW